LNKSMMAFLAFGIVPTVIAFMLHPYICKYDMNIICFLLCSSPLVLGASIAVLLLGDDD